MSDIAPDLDGTGLRIGIVRGRFNEAIGAAMLEACRARLAELGVDASRVDAISVPGALEVPLALQKLATTGHYDALIALGAVIRGETYHFEIVANESSRALTDLSVARRLPLGNGILTVENEIQAMERADPKRGDKGGDAALAALSLIRLKRSLV